MDPHQLDILTRLDTELPMVDPEVLRLKARLRQLADAETLAKLQQDYRAGLVLFGERCLAPGHGPVSKADIDFLFDAVHTSIPPDTDPAVVLALDGLLARLAQIGANIADGDQPLT